MKSESVGVACFRHDPCKNVNNEMSILHTPPKCNRQTNTQRLHRRRLQQVVNFLLLQNKHRSETKKTQSRRVTCSVRQQASTAWRPARCEQSSLHRGGMFAT